MPPNKYELYEAAVQAPEVHIDFMDLSFRTNFKRKPLSIREDFCGTFLISCEWIKSHPDRRAISLDLDPVPLNYGKTVHRKNLTVDQRKRLQVLRKNVLETTRPQVDYVLAGNFSFNIFKDFDTLVRYFQAAYRSLKKPGMFAVEMAGGAGLIEEIKERRRLRRNSKPWFTYVWDQVSFDPVTHDALYKIHFKLPNGKLMKDQFVYDWRLWTIPEVRAAMKQAGFKETEVHWDQEDEDGKNSGVYLKVEKADNDHAWICYVVGVKT